MLPKLVFTDVDGVWTDGGMYYDESGGEWKKFNTSDSAGVLFLRQLNIPLAVITGEPSQAVVRRAEKLQVDHVRINVKHKLQEAKALCRQLQIDLKDTAFIGDDIGDWNLLQEVGLSGAPASAPVYVRAVVDIVTEKKGGEGAFREFVETILRREGLLEKVIKSYVGSLD